MPQIAILALEDGKVFWGKSIGSIGHTVGEVVFNTAMTGYQEILTDPSYCQQIVALTYPHIGNTGINIVDEESSNVYASGLIIRDLPLAQSNWRSEMNLALTTEIFKPWCMASSSETCSARATKFPSAQIDISSPLTIIFTNV